ncbi:hypothetical protein [Bacillus wiedmannii]|uniref:hypothetical protein n=1 Tax=Bacillus wiedmannii TaxID=1890302 RepID=UPI000BFC0189|nr:hypothetical protein [Bacillus wiedmannii]PHF95449.1 hypothetical protein COI45_07385 [Bacillus wiedmannii]
MKNMSNEEMIKHLAEQGYTVNSGESQRQKDVYYQKRQRQDKKHFAWQNTVNQIAVKHSLNDIQKGSLLVMATFLELEGNGRATDTKGNALTVNDFSKVTGKSRRQAMRILEECENIGAITMEKDGKEIVIRFTDMLYICGKAQGDNRQFVKLFKLSVRELIKTFSLKELGLLSDLLPHFHWKTHILCENPTEMELSNIQVWRRKDTIEKLGYSRKFVYDTMNKFKRNKATIEISSAIDVICLSPNLVSRQSDRVTLEEIEKVADSVANNPKVKYL